jgi:uncharacterized protein involved in tolerance to divalent cations
MACPDYDDGLSPACVQVDAAGSAAWTWRDVMNPADFLIVTIIVDGEDHAIRLAEVLVEERLAASVQVPPPHESYRMMADGGGLAVYREWAVRAVTIAGRFEALSDRAAALPGIVMPGITAAPLSVVHPRFEGWLQQVLVACTECG